MPGNSPVAPARPLPRRRPVNGAPGVYYRPRADGLIAPPYEFAFLDLTGHRRWQVVHAPLEQALDEQARHRQRRRPRAAASTSSLTFERFAYDWLARRQVRPRTADRYRWAIERHLLPSLGDYPLSAIDPELVSRLIRELRRRNLKGWSIATAVQPLAMILNDAVRKGHLTANPLKALDRHELPRKTDQRPRRILSLEEMRALLAAAPSEQYRCLLELLITGGLRIGEALGLTTADLDPAHQLIHIRRQLGREKTFEPLKTANSQRVLDIPAGLLEQMQHLLRSRGTDNDPNALIFASRNGTGLERKVCREALNRAAAAADIRQPHPTLHDLRHSNASMLIGLDYSIADVQRRLGHARPSTTLNIYVHEWQQRDARRSTIGDHLAQLLHNP